MRRGAYPWIRLAILDVKILINLGTRAFKTAGVLRALPIMLTALLFIMISVPSDLSHYIYPRKNSISIQSWMVKYQFILAYVKKKVDNR
jgi:hypothetical protein